MNEGNKYALGNNGGRPPKFDEENEEDVERLYSLCEEYFIYIEGEPEVREPQPPTVTGLTLFLGFADKSSLYDYTKKSVFFHPIKRALTRIEQYHETAITGGDKCVGNIFALKNMGWADSVKTDVTSQGEKINANPVIQVEIVKPIDE